MSREANSAGRSAQGFAYGGGDIPAGGWKGCERRPSAVFSGERKGVRPGAAEKLRGEFLYIDRENALELGEDENFIVDLLGCRATDTDGREIGTLTDVMQPGGNDVYVFEGPLGEVLVPALKSVVLRVDVREKTILLDAKRLGEVAVFDED